MGSFFAIQAQAILPKTRLILKQYKDYPTRSWLAAYRSTSSQIVKTVIRYTISDASGWNKA